MVVLCISRDDTAILARFIKECGVEFKLLSDRDGKVIREYGVMSLMGLADRVTFIIDPEGKIAKVIRGFSVRLGKHPLEALKAIKQLAGNPRSLH